MDDQGTPIPWRGLYRLGAIAALVAVIAFRRNFGAELSLLSMMGLTDWPTTPPAGAQDWFVLLRDDPLYGLVQFGMVDMINHVLIGLLFLAACAALRRAMPGIATAAAALYWLGTGVYLATNQGFAMWTLSRQYAAAGTEAERAALLAAGRALLAIHNPIALQAGAGELIALFLVVISGLMLSLAMLRSGVFSRATAYVGLAANGIALTHFLVLFLAPALIALPQPLWAPFRIAWYVMVAVQLLRLARAAAAAGESAGPLSRSAA